MLSLIFKRPLSLLKSFELMVICLYCFGLMCSDVMPRVPIKDFLLSTQACKIFKAHALYASRPLFIMNTSNFCRFISLGSTLASSLMKYSASKQQYFKQRWILTSIFLKIKDLGDHLQSRAGTNIGGILRLSNETEQPWYTRECVTFQKYLYEL